ncbi:hypothetical protein [Gaetbulibacter jejuensis]|jgi:hypothetical protein|uniref:hypothetical protein n=1 Tax=Gaetbulibacter jejuensis TaxID=584607 RepID=UPI003008193A
MKKIIKLLLITIISTSCSSNRYLLTDNNEDRNFLNEKIKEFKKGEDISSKPIIVIDGIPHRYNYELKEEKLKLSKSDIEKIDVLKKDVGIKIYGEFAESGVILITTKQEAKQLKEKNSGNNKSSLEESNVIIFIDGKEFPKDKLDDINPDDIQSVTVIKDKQNIKKYTDKDCDGVILIEMKK